MALLPFTDIPYEIAKKRNHPHLEAIHYAGWVSMFTLHAIWPFLWIWATIYDADRGYGFTGLSENSKRLEDKIEQLEQRLASMEQQVKETASATAPTAEPAPTAQPSEPTKAVEA